MTPAQCRAGRALINMLQARLSHVAVVPLTSVRDFEFAGVITRVGLTSTPCRLRSRRPASCSPMATSRA
jgi:hypothetical protein